MLSGPVRAGVRACGMEFRTDRKDGKMPRKKTMCRATTRSGKMCRVKTIFANGRCRFHGGLSTGPKTEAGRKAALANLRLRWARSERSQVAKT
ncbi:HGGxSTG domain-containing protein [Sphingobium boeckii]|uniref:HGGxSTG domain-containing protein n=1 Tax=Sphingobium boeckii TaxID=1082345 RepID=UPI003CCE19DA